MPHAGTLKTAVSGLLKKSARGVAMRKLTNMLRDALREAMQRELQHGKIKTLPHYRVEAACKNSTSAATDKEALAIVMRTICGYIPQDAQKPTLVEEINTVYEILHNPEFSYIVTPRIAECLSIIKSVEG